MASHSPRKKTGADILSLEPSGCASVRTKDGPFALVLHPRECVLTLRERV